jgi:ornithine--oxo-acid transaminase
VNPFGATGAGARGPLAGAGPDRRGLIAEEGLDSLGILDEALARREQTLELAARHLDPSLVDLLSIIGFDAEYTWAQGSLLHDASGRAYLDFHTGEGFASLGHNHPEIRDVLRATLAADLVDGVQIHFSVLAGMLGEALAERLPAGLTRVHFASAGAEAVDTALKFARAATRRPRLLSCHSGFHGVTLGPLSLVGDDFFKERFGPLLPGCDRVPFGDLDALEAELRRGDVAAFLVEPIQGRTVALPPPGYLQAAGELCRRHGTLFIVDEIQTGLGRTGRWFALEEWGLEPDIVLVGKALSGGYMPVAATVMRAEVHDRAVGTLERSYVHQSTFGRNRLSMAAGLAVLRLIERDRLLSHVEQVGARLLAGLEELRSRHEMVAEVRGRGLMVGIELGAPSSRVGRLNWRLFHLASQGLFPQLVVIPLHREHGVITMASGKNDVIKLLPPLTLSFEDADRFLEAFDAVLADCHNGSGRSWGEVRRIATATLRRRIGRDSALPAPAAGAPVRGRPLDPAGAPACLVTGASGFIGGRLVERLCREGAQVRALVRAGSDASRLERLDVEIVTGDLTDARSLARAVRGCAHVFHCGALVSDWATRSEIEATNVAGTRYLVAAAVEASVRRFIHFSTTDVYGYPGRPAVDETHRRRRFANWYSETKLLAEGELGRAARSGLDTVILRPATVYGPGSREVVGEIARSIKAGRMVLVDGGRPQAGLVYVENLLDAAILALTSEAAPGEAFNITDELEVTWREFTDGLAAGLGCPPVRHSMPYPVASGLGLSLEHGYRLLRRATGLSTPPLLSRQAVQVLGRDQAFSARKARSLLGWTPRVDYAAGLEATLDWLRDDLLATS